MPLGRRRSESSQSVKLTRQYTEKPNWRAIKSARLNTVNGMLRLLIFCSAFASFAVASCITANQPNDNGAVIELPKLPVYPTDGKILPALKNRFVFLDGQNSDKMIVTLPAKNSTRTIVGRMTLNIGVCPSLTNQIKKNGADFEYEYQLTNLPAAHQPLRRWVQPLSL